MSKTAPEIEREVDEALWRCRSLIAEGLWRRMRYLMETTSDRKPYARLDGSPVRSPEQLSHATGCSGAKVTRALSRLLASPKLLKESPEGYVSPLLQRIMEVRGGAARRKNAERRRKGDNAVEGVMSHPQGVTSHGCHTPVTPGPSPPAPSLPLSPTPPLSIPPSPPSPVLGAAKKAGEAGAGKPREPDLPLLLAVHPGFVAAWADWRDHLRRKRVRVTPMAAESQLARCLEWGPERAVAAIRHSIAGSYQGLFEPAGAGRVNGASHGATKPKPDASGRGEFPEAARPLPTTRRLNAVG